MNRRDFLLKSAIGAGIAGAGSTWANRALAQAVAGTTGYRNLVILVELKGGNDGLNTVVPFADPTYKELRPRIAIARDQVLQLSETAGLHPNLAALMPLWKSGELAIVQGVGYPTPNLSHFRSIEIWDTGAPSNEYLDEGWMTRAFESVPPPAAFATDGVVIGSNEMGPLHGMGARAIVLSNPVDFQRQARLAKAGDDRRNSALRHILKVENDIVASAAKLVTKTDFKTEFPKTGFGNSVRTAAQLAANDFGIAALRLTLGGFDTHANQEGPHGNLMRELADGLAALKAALVEAKRWDSTLIMTYAEFGRRPKENQSSGTDHGTVAPHFVMGGRVKGGMYGEAPNLKRLDGSGNLAFAVDFRQLYATALEDWWRVDASRALKGKFAKLPLIAA
jgi:uncharacterized protein (DUF1501 family)